MRQLLNLLLILSFQFVYLEWGSDRSAYMWQMERDLYMKAIEQPAAVIHPFIIIPLVGMLLLLVTIMQRKPSRKLAITGLVCLGSLVLFVFLISLLTLKFKILASTLPFLTVSVIVVFRKKQLR